MTVYTVHEPPRRESDSDLAHAERISFVRDGFSFPAFILGPIWMAWNGLWLVLLGYIVVVGAMSILLEVVHAPPEARTLSALLLALLVGFEATSLARWTLRRRGWATLGVVIADNLQAAERRFFDAWSPGPTSPTSFVPPRTTLAGPPQHVVGLFPEPSP